MTPEKPSLSVFLLAAGLVLATGLAPQTGARAQTDANSATAATADTSEVPTMAEIEQAWRAGDFVFVREGLKTLAETEGTALAQYRYGRVLAEGRGGPRDMQAAAEWLQKAVDQNNNDAAVLLSRIYLSAKTDDAAQAAGALLSRAAARGHPEGQYYLGLLLRSGRGVEQNLEEAFNWLLASAEQGFVESQFELARAYSRGEGTPQSNADAEKWLTEAAGNGHVQSQFLLALALDKGQGVEQNRTAALGWYRRAAEAGHLQAQRELGLRYLQGIGTDRNVEEGLRWLSSAGQAGEAGAQLALGHAFAGVGDFGITPDDAQAARWYNMAAAQSYPPGMVALAGFMETGRGVEQDFPGAVELYRRVLRETGYPAAALRLGQLAAEGKLGSLVAPQRAVPWVVLAAEQGHPDALAWLEDQARGENRPARTGLAIYLQNSEGDETRIASLFADAAEMGDVMAQFKLGELYTTGSGVELDYVQAHKWFNIAAAQGNSQAAEQRDTVGKLMTPDQIAEAQAAARVWFEEDSRRIPQTSQEVRTDDPSGDRND